jgi:putative outer membrane protein
MNNRCLLFLFFIIIEAFNLCAQNITGTVTDEKTGAALPFVNVFYDGGHGVQTDSAGHYSLPKKNGKLYFSLIGYVSKSFVIKEATRLDVALSVDNIELGVAVVKSKKTKYSRKNNPAVIMMQKVIAAKKKSDLSVHPYYSYNKYQKLTFALNEISDKVFEEGGLKKVPFLKEHVEVCPETGKKILPISVDETVTQLIYRKNPKSEKQIILGQRSNGINDLLSTGDILTTLIKDCFTDVDIYDDEVRLLQYPFHSPISTRSAISFYRYFIEDTVMIGKDKCFELSFTPNNPQDFGFSGTLYIMADSSYRVRKIEMGIPRHSDVNYVDNMMITQEFAQLPSGEQVLITDEMLVQLKIAKFIQRFQVKRLTEYSDYSLEPIPDKKFKFNGVVKKEPYAMMQDNDFWKNYRAEDLTKSESSMDALVKRLSNIKGFKAILFVGKAFIENFVETSVSPEHPSKVDIGPINTMITQNFVDGLRLRASAQTTANLNPHWFLKGYVAYGFKDERWKGMGEVTYSFNKKAYLPREFPVNNLTFTYSNDVMSPSDKFMPTDKDNVFTSFKWDKVDHMMYYENYRLFYDREWNNGLRFTTFFRRSKNTPTASLFYQPLNGTNVPDASGQNITNFVTSEFNVGVRYQPGATWINTKQRRIAANNDAPIFALNHTVGIKNLFGGQYNYNYTEAEIYKRFWVGSWGKIDNDIRAGVQWNKVPFPLLIMPAANLSYIMEDNTFNLINNMEFLNDRFVSYMVSWDINGKILNRIPLIKKLKWREYIGCNVLWGMLSDKNNPYCNANDKNLFYFPGRFNSDGSYTAISHVMDKKVPYVEAIVGIHNIFKLLHIEYVRRLTYIDRPGTSKWGIRFMFRATF